MRPIFFTSFCFLMIMLFISSRRQVELHFFEHIVNIIFERIVNILFISLFFGKTN